MKAKNLLIFTGLFFTGVVIFLLNLTINLSLISHIAGMPIIKKAGNVGISMQNSRFISERKLILGTLSKKLNLTIKEYEGNFTEEWLRSLREKFNSKFSAFNDKYMLPNPFLLTYYEISEFNNLYFSNLKQPQVDDAFRNNIHRKLLKRINFLIYQGIVNQYLKTCKKPTAECNKKFLEKLKNINKKLEKDISLIQSLPEPNKCSRTRDYLWLRFMENKLSNYYRKVNIDEISKFVYLANIKAFKKCALRLRRVSRNHPCIKPDNFITSFLSSSFAVSYAFLISSCMSSNVEKTLKVLENV